MKVYILMGYVQFEGTFLLDVFATREDAEKAKSIRYAVDKEEGYSYYDGYQVKEKEVLTLKEEEYAL